MHVYKCVVRSDLTFKDFKSEVYKLKDIENIVLKLSSRSVHIECLFSNSTKQKYI